MLLGVFIYPYLCGWKDRKIPSTDMNQSYCLKPSANASHQQRHNHQPNGSKIQAKVLVLVPSYCKPVPKYLVPVLSYWFSMIDLL